MAAVYTRVGVRCQEHPHRPADQKCDRCGLGFCDECLTPGERRDDGTRPWHCAKCLWLMREEEARAALERSLEYRVAQAARRARITAIAGGTAALLIVVSTITYFVLARRFGTAAQTLAVEGAASCGELSRVRSVGAVGAPGPDDVVNVLAYPHRARVRLVGQPASTPPGLESIVDECAPGWLSSSTPTAPTAPTTPASLTLPLTIELELHAENAVPVQRLAFWQDPQAPRAAWIRDFELLASANAEGEDFVALPLDRAPRLEATVEQQWFAIVQAQAMGLTLDRVARGGAQATGAAAQPDVARVRRLRLRVLSTHTDTPGAAPAAPTASHQVALGEIAAYGPDQQIGVAVVCANITPLGNDSCVYGFVPREVRALAGRPRFVYFVNDTDVAHTFTTVGQDKNADVRVGPGQSATISFTAASLGTRYEFFCRTADHASQGMRGTILIR